MINMLREIVGKVDNRQEQMDNVSREMQTLRKEKEMLDINILTEIKNTLNWLVRFNRAEDNQ